MKMQKQKDVAQALAHVLKEKLEMNKRRDDPIKEMEELRGEQAARTIRSSRAELEAATNNIDGSRIIGQRGVGTLYKGRSRHQQHQHHLHLLNKNNIYAQQRINASRKRSHSYVPCP